MSIRTIVVVLTFIVSGIDVLYGDTPAEKKDFMNTPVFTLNADYIHVYGGAGTTKGGETGDDAKKARELESDEWNIHASGNYNIDSMKIKNKAYYKTAEYSAEGFPERLISMGGDKFISNGDYVFLGGIKYAADTYTKSMNAANLQVMGGVSFYRSGPHSVIAGIFYTTEKLYFDWGTFLPYVTYRYKTGTLLLEAPMPLMMMWRPSKKWNIRLLSVLVIWNTISIEYRVLPFLGLSAEYSKNNESYYIHDHPDKDEKLILEKQSAGGKIRFDIGRYAGLYAYGGYQFNNSYYYSEKTFNWDDDVEKQKIENSWIVKVGVEIRVF
jgi:hypothetical protein